MVDFDAIFKKMDEKLTLEERAHRAKFNKLEKAHMYYETTCMMTEPYKTANGLERTKEREIKVEIFSKVDFHTLEVGEKLYLRFEPTPSYYFGRKFVTRWLTNSHGEEIKGMYIDMGREWLVPQKEMDRIVTEGTKKIEELGLLAKWELE